MRISRVNDSTRLPAGTLFVVRRGWRILEYGYFGLQPKHFYCHRQDPVPWTGHGRHRRVFRFPQTRNERRINDGGTREIKCLITMRGNAGTKVSIRLHLDE
jgi:hypothetical protein